jgi:hypothetical protein
MFGQGVFVGVVDFCAGAGVVEVDGVELVGVELVGAAAAPAIPMTAPPVAIAPTTIVALSVFEMCIGESLQVWREGVLSYHYARPS